MPEVTPAFSKEVSAQCQELCTRWIQTKRGKKIVKRRKRGDAAFTLPEIIGAKGQEAHLMDQNEPLWFLRQGKPMQL